jgi:hypothetical protein
MAIPVFIDTCAWDWLFARQVDLGEAFPGGKYALFVTREVEIELASIPDEKDGKDKRPLKLYIAESITKHGVGTTSVFGFASVEADGSLSKVQVYGGFGQGTFRVTMIGVGMRPMRSRSYCTVKQGKVLG